MHTQHTRTTKQLRSFGLIVGSIFALIGLWPLLWRGQPLRLWGVLLGGILMTLALLMPRSLAQVYRLWMTVGDVLGRINSSIILGVLFYCLFTPMGLVMRLLGKDPMRRALLPGEETYRVRREARPASHMPHQF